MWLSVLVLLAELMRLSVLVLLAELVWLSVLVLLATLMRLSVLVLLVHFVLTISAASNPSYKYPSFPPKLHNDQNLPVYLLPLWHPQSFLKISCFVSILNQMAELQFIDHHNMLAMLSKVKESEGFHEVLDFLRSSHLAHALTVNPMSTFNNSGPMRQSMETKGTRPLGH